MNTSNYGELLLSTNGTATLKQFVSGTPTTVSGTWTATTAQFAVKITRTGTTTNVKINGVQIFNATQSGLTAGKIGVRAQNSRPQFDDIVVQ